MVRVHVCQEEQSSLWMFADIPHINCNGSSWDNSSIFNYHCVSCNRRKNYIKCLQTHSNSTQHRQLPLLQNYHLSYIRKFSHCDSMCTHTCAHTMVCNCCSKTWDIAKSANLLHLFLVTYIIAHITDQPGKTVDYQSIRNSENTYNCPFSCNSVVYLKIISLSRANITTKLAQPASVQYQCAINPPVKSETWSKCTDTRA